MGCLRNQPNVRALCILALLFPCSPLPGVGVSVSPCLCSVFVCLELGRARGFSWAISQHTCCSSHTCVIKPFSSLLHKRQAHSSTRHQIVCYPPRVSCLALRILVMLVTCSCTYYVFSLAHISLDQLSASHAPSAFLNSTPDPFPREPTALLGTPVDSTLPNYTHSPRRPVSPPTINFGVLVALSCHSLNLTPK